MYQSSYDVGSLDYDVIVLLSVATRQLVVSIHYIAQSLDSEMLRFSLGLLQNARLPVMTTAQTASLVMDSYLVALYQVYDTDSFLGSL